MVNPRRGELWTVAGSDRITSKPRPALIITSDLFAAYDHVTVVLLTSDATDSPARVTVPANDATGLAVPSHVMCDKLHTIRRSSLGQRIGHVSPAVMVDVERAILVYLDIG